MVRSLHRHDNLFIAKSKSRCHIYIGGINKETAKQVEKADVIVSGSFLFNHPKSLSQGVLDILENA